MFSEELEKYSWDDITACINSKQSRDVEIALGKEHLTIDDFMALVSPAAAPYLEPMAALSRRYTQERFGKTIQMYVPLYITNSCNNFCVYCGFNHNNPISRIILTEEEIENECRAIRKLGPFENLLIVTGENPRDAGVDYLERALHVARPYFANPQGDEIDFRMACQRLRPHGSGRRAQDRHGRAHRAGALAHRCDHDGHSPAIPAQALLADEIQRQLPPHAAVGGALPTQRGDERPGAGPADFCLPYLRPRRGIFDHDVDISVSTRENPNFRNHIATLGATSMSAGSKTDPGGYATYPQALEQFAVSDERTPAEVEQAIKAMGYEVVWKDWDKIFD